MASGTMRRPKRGVEVIDYVFGGQTKTISYDLSNVDFIYAVFYAPIQKYCGGVMMPVSLFDIHPQVIDYFNLASGVVEYNSSTKQITFYSNTSEYSLYIYKVV